MHRVRGDKMEELNEPTTVESKSRLQKILTSDALTQYRIKKGSSSNTTESKEKDTNIIPISRKIKQELIDREIPNKRKRKDSTDSETNTDNNNKATENKEQADSVEEIDETFYTIIVSNFPESWIFEKICAYISKVLPGMPVIIESDDNNKHEVRINFKSSEQWLTGQDILRDKVVGGRKLHIESEGPMTDADSDTSQATDIIPSMEHDIWETDPQGLYGLKLEYLKSLNITPPIGKWVHVTNFRCDKSELRDAFELAGTVVACSIINTTNKYAKIMYSHPLEAIQAISMLHNQVFYGQRLNIVMDKTANSERVLPKGLLSIGPGLGEDGYGVREIAKEYERFLEGKSTSINLSLFKNGNVDEIVIPNNMRHSLLGVDKVLISESNAQVSRTSPQLPKASSPNGPPGVDPVMDQPVSGPLGPKGRPAGPQDSGQYGNRSPGPVFRAPMPRGPGPVAPGGSMAPGASVAAGGSTAPGGPMAPGGSMAPGGTIAPGGSMAPGGSIGPRPDLYPPGQFPRGYLPPNRMPMQYLQNLSGPVPNLPLSAPVQSIASNWPGPYNAGLMTRMLKTGDPNTLKIINLPPTTSFPSLCAKLSTLAQVTSLEFTTPGCAVVRFVSPGDTEKCFQSYRNIQLS